MLRSEEKKHNEHNEIENNNNQQHLNQMNYINSKFTKAKCKYYLIKFNLIILLFLINVSKYIYINYVYFESIRVMTFDDRRLYQRQTMSPDAD